MRHHASHRDVKGVMYTGTCKVHFGEIPGPLPLVATQGARVGTVVVRGSELQEPSAIEDEAYLFSANSESIAVPGTIMDFRSICLVSLSS